MGSLEKKIAMVTGGSRGLGRCIALALAEAGANIAIVDRTAEDERQRVVDEITQIGSRAVSFYADVSDANQAREVVEKATEEFGRLDILVNNAGITKDSLLMRMTEEDWDSVIDVNLKSVFNFCKAAIRPMMSQRSGKIINIASVVGITGNAGQTNYSASKAGIIGFTKSLAKELGSRNIQVNAVAPGFVETGMTAKLTEEQRKALADAIPLKRTARPEEVAGVVRFLATHEADYMTGQVICVDGGLAM